MLLNLFYQNNYFINYFFNYVVLTIFVINFANLKKNHKKFRRNDYSDLHKKKDYILHNPTQIEG